MRMTRMRMRMTRMRMRMTRMKMRMTRMWMRMMIVRKRKRMRIRLPPPKRSHTFFRKVGTTYFRTAF